MSVDNLEEGISKIIPAHLSNFIAQMDGAIWMTEGSLLTVLLSLSHSVTTANLYSFVFTPSFSIPIIHSFSTFAPASIINFHETVEQNKFHSHLTGIAEYFHRRE